MHRIILFLMCAILVGCTKAPEKGGAATPSWRHFGTGGELYTDAQAEAFRDLVNRIGLPTTPEKACATLGIDISRLEEPVGPINGRVMLESTRLSEGYYIHFGTPIWPTNVVADGGCVTAVRILATNSTESIHVPNLDDENLQNKSLQRTR